MHYESSHHYMHKRSWERNRNYVEYVVLYHLDV